MSLQYVIDGYNLLNHQLLSKTRKNNTSDPAKIILSFIQEKRLTGSRKNGIILVFDGYPKTGSFEAKDPGITLLFSRGVSADEKIKKIVEGSANRKILVVVSDDKEIQFLVKSLGARVLAIADFVGLEDQEKEPARTELSYSQMHKINQELSKLWLK
ncbi:MAG: NYN domain-containing protein [Candidatus Omnitrophica bacterium]|nr:NYN domain-containing protein [Candidatus Omnitrophota bacterium]